MIKDAYNKFGRWRSVVILYDRFNNVLYLIGSLVICLARFHFKDVHILFYLLRMQNKGVCVKRPKLNAHVAARRALGVTVIAVLYILTASLCTKH